MINESFWNRKRLNSQLDSDQKIIKWGQQIGLPPNQKFCYGRSPNQHAKYEMAFYQNRSAHGMFVCTKCNSEKSIMSGTWFEEARLPLEKILRYKLNNNLLVF